MKKSHSNKSHLDNINFPKKYIRTKAIQPNVIWWNAIQSKQMAKGRLGWNHSNISHLDEKKTLAQYSFMYKFFRQNHSDRSHSDKNHSDKNIMTKHHSDKKHSDKTTIEQNHSDKNNYDKTLFGQKPFGQKLFG